MSLFRNTDGRDPFAGYDRWKTTDTEGERRAAEADAFDAWLESEDSDAHRRWTTDCCGAEWEWCPKIGETCEACELVIHDGTTITVTEPTEDDWQTWRGDNTPEPPEPDDDRDICCEGYDGH